jgi:hypothetical protein
MDIPQQRRNLYLGFLKSGFLFDCCLLQTTANNDKNLVGIRNMFYT